MATSLPKATSARESSPADTADTVLPRFRASGIPFSRARALPHFAPIPLSHVTHPAGRLRIWAPRMILSR